MNTPDPTSLEPQPQLPTEAARAYEQAVLDWSQDLPDGIVAVRHLRYGTDRQHSYDVFTANTLRNAPVLVFWHGGGWTNGYKEYVSFLASNVIRLGMVLVAPTYRLAPAHRLPAAFDDAVALLAELPRRIGAFGGDASRLYLAGHSAGGGIAAMAALRTPALRAAGVGPEAIRGCLPISGIMDLHHPSPVPQSLEDRVYTMLLEAPDLDAVMSPLCWAAGNTVPMILSYGEHDSERVILSNRRLRAMLACQAGPVACHVHQGEDHFRTHTALRDPSHPWFARLSALVKETSQ